MVFTDPGGMEVPSPEAERKHGIEPRVVSDPDPRYRLTGQGILGGSWNSLMEDVGDHLDAATFAVAPLGAYRASEDGTSLVTRQLAQNRVAIDDMKRPDVSDSEAFVGAVTAFTATVVVGTVAGSAARSVTRVLGEVFEEAVPAVAPKVIRGSTKAEFPKPPKVAPKTVVMPKSPSEAGFNPGYGTPGTSFGRASSRQVTPGATDLSQKVIDARVAAKATGNNYGAARLDDGTIIVEFSGKKGTARSKHSEELLVERAESEGRQILEIYTERQPCAAKCEDLTKSIPTTWSFRWNADTAEAQVAVRASSTTEIKAYIKKILGK